MGNRGRLRVYLGAAPGVGKTYAMLGEGHRRAERGTDVVVGFVETHGRQHTAEMVEGLEVVPRRTLEYRDSVFEEMDVDAVLRRRPTVALVDELAHTNVPGSRNAKRWQDIEELLAAGIDVITTVNIQHLESVNDVVEKITGVPAARDRSRCRGAGGRPDRARGHGRGSAAEAVGPRQRLRAREGRRRAVELLPGRQPQRPARAGAAVDRRPGRRRPPAVPRDPRHHRHLGGPGAGGGRAHRRARGRDAHPPGRADRGPVQPRRPARRPRGPVRRPDRREPRHPGRPATPRGVARGDLPPGAGRRRT